MSTVVGVLRTPEAIVTRSGDSYNSFTNVKVVTAALVVYIARAPAGAQLAAINIATASKAVAMVKMCWLQSIKETQGTDQRLKWNVKELDLIST